MRYLVKYPMPWQGVILMDCWGGAWHQRCARSAESYQRMVRTIQVLCGTVDTIIEATYPIGGLLEIDPVFRTLECHHRITTVTDWEQFARHNFNRGDWLLVGQSWDRCTHQRRLGLMSYLDSDLVRCRLWSHPDLLDHVPERSDPVTHADFARDPRVSWQQSSDGMWRVCHARIPCKKQ